MDDSDSDPFTDGWRDPGDDCDRGAGYIVMALGLIGMPVMAGAGGIALAGALRNTSQGAGQHALAIFGSCLMILIGLAGFVGLLSFFVHESKYWNLKHMTADRFIAGMFLFGLSLSMLGFRTFTYGGHSLGSTLLTMLLPFAGLIVLLGALVAGLIAAFLPRLFIWSKRIDDAMVLDRYVLDDKAMQRTLEEMAGDEHWTPIVKFRTPKGREMTVVAYQSAYAVAEPGRIGRAKIKGNKLIAFARVGSRWPGV